MLLRLLLALGAICLCTGQYSRILESEVLAVPEGKVLTPPYFNIASGKKISSTATCGTEGPELFCKLTGGSNFEFSTSLHQGQVCDECNARRQEKAHPVNNAIDGTEKWWQSPPLSRGNEFNKINITIDLAQVFHVAYVLIKFANSPRAGTWVLERSSDYGESFQPWQYFANTDSDCYNLFGMDSLEEITRDDSVICTSDYSSVVPLENGEVIVSMIKHRPGSNNFSYAPVLQEWSKATNVRLRLLRTKTLLGHLMAVSEEDPTVTRRYYYSIKDISIGGRCVCNGHADTCKPDEKDAYKLKCECQHHTCGDSCEMCCPGYVQKAWKAAVPESFNECEACNCHGHTTECIYDEDVARRRLSLDLAGNYEGGGVCQNCQDHTAGINCELCADGYWRPIDKSLTEACIPCDCNSQFTLGTCEPNTGRCYCKPQYTGDRCDSCAPGYYDFPDCRPCDCYYNGTLNEVCLPLGDACPCKYNFAGKYCDECAPGFFDFPNCRVCECRGEGVASDVCDPYSGACPCVEGFAGPECKECAAGYFNYPLCQRCPCSDTGTTDDVCDPNTGECFCAEKYTGRSCDDCKPGHFGFPICQECQCTQPGSASSECDTRTGRCQCKPNYMGENCGECAVGFYGYPNCLECACDVYGSQRATCDPVNGQCMCMENIGGRQCDQCVADTFNFPNCEECSCDTRGIVSVVPGVCLAFTTGQCECKDNYMGKNCDMCKPLHYDLDRGCVDCNCFTQGTLDGVAECYSDDGQCFCKPYTCTQRCSQCRDGFFSLEERNYLGCTPCQCDVGGSKSQICDKNTGQCQCRDNVAGRRCDRPADGYYFPTLYDQKYEMEDGVTQDNTIVRFGFDESKFPGYSMRGYAEFSLVQPTVHVPIRIHNSGLYRLMFRYRSTSIVVANVTVVANNVQDDGIEQSFKVDFHANEEPQMVTVPKPFVLNRGTWTVVIEADPGLLIDYLVLMPSEFYEPKILELAVTKACVPKDETTGRECVMFTHPDLSQFTQVNLVGANVDKPSSAHPDMVNINAQSGDSSARQLTQKITLPKAGKYVLVLEYASSENRAQVAKVTVTDGATNTYNDVKFNIFHCYYTFMCRQVALGVLDDVQVFEMSLPMMEVSISSKTGDSFYVHRLTAIHIDDWVMSLVEPKPRCITQEGPTFEKCLASKFAIPTRGVVFDPESSNRDDVINGHGGERPSTIGDDQVPLIKLENNGQDNDDNNNKKTLQITKNLTPGRYVFVVHYYNPNDHRAIFPQVVIDGGVASTGSVNVTYCPFSDGCRAVFTSDDGKMIVDITVPTTTFTMTAPEGSKFWVEYVLAIPESKYNPSLLDVKPVDNSNRFLSECGTDDQQSFHGSLPSEAPSEFCEESIFSLTVDYADGALNCNCSGAGTIGGADAQCQQFGGQCPCKPYVIGRQCDQCLTGYYGYPDCKLCACDGALCDKQSGECICPPNTIPPACDTCQPLTHSYHIELGCMECDCDTRGVSNRTDRGCDENTGQCRCRDHVGGVRCDQCEPGYYGFPHCTKCSCDPRGSASDTCDRETGHCVCKDNVEGQQCDRCKEGSFNLDEANPLGCTECFCFGVSDVCHVSQYPSTEIYDMNEWRVNNLNAEKPNITSSSGTLTVDVPANGGQKTTNTANIYWAAPRVYLGDKVASYGGELSFQIDWYKPSSGRGDSDFDVSNPAPILGQRADVILGGKTLNLAYYSPTPGKKNFNIKLTESNFKTLDGGNDVKRADLMMVLAQLSHLHIRASPEIGAERASLKNVVLTTTDYNLPRGSGQVILGAEECTCPPGYIGHSCQQCDRGYYRDTKQGPYLGFCRQCDCYPHCDSCGDNGQLKDTDKCLHNTGGTNCKECIEGFIGNFTDGIVENCQPCPCPRSEDNHADSCEIIDNELMCYCEMGYTGERCELCANGYFGNPAVLGGSCKMCNCHGNLDPNMILETCDSFTGECHDCMFNTGGKYCERCADGFYGDAIVARNCTECECSGCGTATCDHEFGFCSCKDHVVGHYCDRCEPGYFNFASCGGCESCDCGIGSLGTDCDLVTGQCKCAPNVVGVKCDKCAPGFWDYSAEGCKPCNCRKDGPCNPVDGTCTCPPGITGPQCDQCELPRHILHLGATECTRCGTCTDDLLDVVEPLTDATTNAFNSLANISIGVFALTRLQNFQEQAEDVMTGMIDESQTISNIISTTDELLANGLADIGDDISGSGEEGSGWNSEPSNTVYHKEVSTTKAAVDQIDFDVSDMCNHTEILLGKVEETKEYISEREGEYDQFDGSVDGFSDEVTDLLSEFEQSASGDALDYSDRLMEADMMLQKMKMRNFPEMKDVEEAELDLSEQLFFDVERNLTNVASDMEADVTKATDAYTNIHDKLHDLRSQMNAATLNTNDATTLNAVNKQNLIKLQEDIAGITANIGTTTDALDDAEQTLDASNTAIETIQAGMSDSDALADVLKNTETPRLEADIAATGDVSDLQDSVDAAVQHAEDLRADADALSAISTDFDKSPAGVSNMYKKTSMAMDEAEKASQDALMAATKAEHDVANRDWQAEANAARDKASDLLTTSQDLQNQDLSDLRDSNTETAGEVDVLNDKYDAMLARLDQLDAEIESVNQAIDDNAVSSKVDAVVQDADDANALSAQAEEAAAAAEAAAATPHDSGDLPRELATVSAKLDTVPETIDAITTDSQNLRDTFTRLQGLEENLQMLKVLAELKKKIQQTRSVANRVKSSVQFSSTEEEYLELRTPITTKDVSHGLAAEFYVNATDTSPNNMLMFIGDASDPDADSMQVETVDGQVKYTFKVNGNEGSATTTRAINNGKWHRIAISRNGNEGTLDLYYDAEGARGDGEQGEEVESITVDTGADDMVSNMNAASMDFYVGGLAGKVPEGNTAPGTFCMTEVKMNNDTVGLWHFKTYKGPKPGRSCVSRSRPAAQVANQVLRFRGIDSYLRARREDTGFFTQDSRKTDYIGFQVDTLQANSLLFLLGNTPEQFMALEVVQGKLVMTWNFGFADGPHSSTVEDPADITQSSSFLIIKAGVATSFNIVVMSVNFNLVIKEKYDSEYHPDLSGDVYIGGIYCQDLPPGFEGVLANVKNHYRGCLREIQFNGIVYDFENAVENIGVTRGCVKEKITDLQLESEDSVSVATGLDNVDAVEGTIGFCADISSGHILEVTDPGRSGVIELPPAPEADDDSELVEAATTTQAATTTTTTVVVPETRKIVITEPPPAPTTPPPTTTTTTTEAPETTTEFGLYIPPEQARMVGNPRLHTKTADVNTAGQGTSIMPVLVFIAAVVLIALVAAVISAVMKSSSFANTGGSVPSVFAPEEQPLNNVAPSRSAQVEW